MRKLSFLVAAVALFAVAILAVHHTPATAEVAGVGDSVAICHFPGHNGDFVAGNQAEGATNSACRGSDGETDTPLGGDNASGEGIVMRVSVKACEKGHKAGPVPAGPNAGGTCASMAS